MSVAEQQQGEGGPLTWKIIQEKKKKRWKRLVATVGELVLLSNFGAVCSADHNEGSGGSRQEAQDELECRAADAAGPGRAELR